MQQQNSSSEAREVHLVLAGLVVFIGLIGAVANILVIFVVTRAKALHSVKSINTLILNQLAIDLYSCLLLVVTYCFKLSGSFYPNTESSADIALCMLLDSELLLSLGLDGSTASLVFIASERYLKIVHPVQHRHYFRSWMTYIAIIITWINGALVEIPGTASTTVIKNNLCIAYYYWPTFWQPIVFSGFFFIWHYLGPAVLLVYFYWHIAIVIRGRMRINPSETGDRDVIVTKEQAVARNQLSGIKTLVVIAVLFIVGWLPNQVYGLLVFLPTPYTRQDNGWYGTLFVVFTTVCFHPFIYAGKIDGVKQYIVGLLNKRTSIVAVAVVPLGERNNDLSPSPLPPVFCMDQSSSTPGAVGNPSTEL